MNIVVVNPETGEERVLEPDANGRYPNMRAPWRAKGATLAAATPKPQGVVPTVYRTVGETLHTIGNVFGVNCTPCNLRYLVTKNVGTIGVTKANDFIKRSFRVQEGTPEFVALKKEVEYAIKH